LLDTTRYRKRHSEHKVSTIIEHDKTKAIKLEKEKSKIIEKEKIIDKVEKPKEDEKRKSTNN